ncbi:hypothetical protein IFR04_014486 [Cadophora malorum]|uniref:BTB domain-containing protein n=1 Tax=Cadophora malorum TaxID=108018 RepID=A0A8H7W0B8_9HELO|nr:hypothetical protein IFR04_014486 [Cadophora malorum]
MASAPATDDGGLKANASDQASTQPVNVDFSLQSQTMVTFIIGAEPVKQNFLVHKHLASAHSPFFKAAFESPMLEDDADYAVKAGFGAFTNDKGDPDYDLTAMAKVWRLAERFLMPRLQNPTIADMFINRKIASDESIVQAATYVSADQKECTNKLRKLVMQIVALYNIGSRYRKMAPGLPYNVVYTASMVLSCICCSSILICESVLGLDSSIEPGA